MPEYRGYIPLASNSGSQEDSHEPLVQLPQEDPYYESHGGDVGNTSTHLGSFSAHSGLSFESDSESGMLTPPADPELLRLLDINTPMVTPIRARFPLFESPEVSPGGSADYSDVSDADIRPGLICPICDPRRQVRVAFRECSHGACRTCTVRLWRAKWEHVEFPPMWFPCPFCRAEVHHVGVIADGSVNGRDVLTEIAERGGFGFMVKVWLSVQRWVALQNELEGRKAGLGLNGSVARWLEASAGEDVENGEGWMGGSSPLVFGSP